MLLPSPVFRRLSPTRYWAAAASWCTAFRAISLLVLPLAVTLSLYTPWVATLTALLKKLGDSRLVAGEL